MKKEIELAKNQGLNWQALLIEDAQSEIKVAITRGVIRHFEFEIINREVEKIINKLVKELESEELKQRSKVELFRFANRIYLMLRPLFIDIDLAVLMSIRKVANNEATDKDKRITRQYLTFMMPRQFERAVSSIDERVQPLDMFARDYMKLVNERLKEISALEPKEYDTKVNLRNIAEMQVRLERQQENLQKMVDAGIDLVWIVPHANCSKRCEPYQGRLYSISGKSGTIDGIRFDPLTEATHNERDRYVTKSGKVYQNGCLTGFNCRHKIEAYKKGNKPREVSAKVVEKERKINDTQRYFENGIRSWKNRALEARESGDKKMFAYCKNKADEWNRKYIAYSKKNEVAYYPSRTSILSNEKSI